MFCRPVVTAPAVVRRDGTVLADAWLPEPGPARQLERHLGDGVIEALVDAALEEGLFTRRQRRRIMSYPLVIRLMIAMTLMPGASLLRGAGPAGRAARRYPVHPGLAYPDGEGGDGLAAAGAAGPDGEPVLAGGRAARERHGAVGGDAGRDARGRGGRDAGQPGRYPGEPGVLRLDRDCGRLRAVPAAADRRGDRPRRPGQARRHPGPGGGREQTLLKRLVKRGPELFANRVTCFDQFPGHDLITAIVDAGGHVIARVKEGISLGFEDGPGRGWLPDGSRMTWLNARPGRRRTGCRSAPPSTT